jgi:hypothetical protein
MKAWRILTVVSIGFHLGVTAGRAGTSDVYRVDAFLQGVVQSGGTNIPHISKVQVITVDLINFGLGRPLGTSINPNEVLALASDCTSNQLRMIVYDLASGGNLATIGTAQPVLEVVGLKKGKLTRDIISDLVILPTGDGTNGLTGGGLTLSASILTVTNDCLNSLKGTMIGTLGAVFPSVITNFPCTNFITCSLTNVDFCVTNCVSDGTTNIINTVTNYNVAVSKGILQTKGKKIGTLIENP